MSEIDGAQAEASARALAAARAEGRKLDTPPGPDPKDWDEGYAIQDALIRVTDSPVVGWKIGATSKRAQDLLGVDGPFSGPLFERWVTESPAEVATPARALRIIEPEFALRLSGDLPARDDPYTADEIAAAVGAVHCAFEIIDRRLAETPGGRGSGGFQGSPYWFPADAGANAGFVLGPGREDWRTLDLQALTVEVYLDGHEKTRGISANAMGGPLQSLGWLVEHLRGRGIGLVAGQVVTTGVVTEIFTAQPGETVHADYEGIGSVTIEMAEY